MECLESLREALRGSLSEELIVGILFLTERQTFVYEPLRDVLDDIDR